jgi:hypothetical protein
MRVEYICHACLLIDTGEVKLLTDPWFQGPAYCGQWHLFPKPVDTRRVHDADYVLVSHGHEDHLHDESLRALPKGKPVLYPYYWYGGAKEYLRSLGFGEVREVGSFKTVSLGARTRVTFVSNYLDTIMVIEAGERVLVDVNDALHASHPNVIDIFLRAIRKRWPRIDTVFCGFGGAHYFPNSVHVEGKDDEDVGRLREQLFLHNFCRIVHGLSPRVAVPFAADFALLDPEKMWINRTRFPRERIPDYYREHFGRDGSGPAILPMYPGDVLDGDTLHASSPYREEMRNDRLSHLIFAQYADEIARRKAPSVIDEAGAARLRDEMEANIAARTGLYDAAFLDGLVFCVRVRDVAENACYNVSFAAGVPVVRRAGAPAGNAALVVETQSRILRYGFASDWGGDAMLIGYGWEVFMRDREAVKRKLDAVCLRLLTRIPSAKHHMLKTERLRAVRYVAGNPLTRQWVGRYLVRKSKQRAIYDQELWLNRTKCEVCQACDIPLLDYDFSSAL